MEAFVEILSGIVRVGPQCSSYQTCQTYDYAVSFSSVDGRTAVIKGFVSEGRLKHSHFKAVRNALASVGLEMTYERKRADAQPNKQAHSHSGETAMSHGPHVDSTKGKDGKHDQKAVRATAQAALNDPSLHFEPVTEYDGVFNGRDGTFKTFHVSKA